MGLFDIFKKDKVEEKNTKKDYKSIYEIIKENLTDGKLPSNFDLSNNNFFNKLNYAPGAADAIIIYHQDKRKDIDIDPLIECIINNDFSRFLAIIDQLMYDDIIGFAVNLMYSFDKNMEKIYKLVSEEKINIDIYDTISYRFLTSDDTTLVKVGLIMQSIFPEPGEGTLKDILLTLPLYSEFTFYIVNGIKYWNNGNEILFDMLKKTSGWGMYHILSKIDINTDKIKKYVRDYIINNENDMMLSYCMFNIYKYVYELLDTDMKEKDIIFVSKVFNIMQNEDAPVRFTLKDEVIEKYKDIVKKKGLIDKIKLNNK